MKIFTFIGDFYFLLKGSCNLIIFSKNVGDSNLIRFGDSNFILDILRYDNFCISIFRQV